MASHRLSILHLSDLHARSASGVPDDRARQVALERRSRCRVLGEEFFADLGRLFHDRPPDIVCFTGDVADWGMPTEFGEATKLFDELRKVLKVPRDRIFVVPGNHDVQRTVGKAAWKRVRKEAFAQTDAVSRWMADVGSPRGLSSKSREALLARTEAFWAWVEAGLGRPDLLPKNSAHGRLGYRSALRLDNAPFDIHIVGLDSAWLAGDENDAGKLRLTRGQTALGAFDPVGQPLDGFRIGLVHHPLSDLADVGDVRQELADSLDLLLHGHQHGAVVETWADPDRTLRVLAAGCLFEGEERDDYKNSYQRIDVWLDPNGRPLQGQVRFRGWSSTGHWLPDSALYKAAPKGGLAWKPWLGRDAGLSKREAPLVPVSTFVGRERELAELGRALLGTSTTGHAGVASIYGMAGVGKSYLVEHFYQENKATFPGGVLRVALQNVGQISAEALVYQLAEQRSVEPSLLAECLNGPRTLVVIDSVDTEADVALVARVQHDLQGCSIVVTGRVHELGRASGWTQVALDTLSVDEAVGLLEAESERATTGSERDQLVRLSAFLGHLPLALYLCAAHLRRGLSPEALLTKLTEHSLDLEPLDASDPRLRADQARSKLESSLSLSWAALIERVGEERATWLARVGQLPADEFGLPLAAATVGLAATDLEYLLAEAVGLCLLRSPTSERRWGMHPLVRLYCAKHAAAGGANRIAAWFERQMFVAMRATGAAATALLQDERDSLTVWLGGLSAADAAGVVVRHREYALRNGPFRVWADLVARIRESPSPWSSQLSLIQADLLHNLGDYDSAYECAQALLLTTTDRHATVRAQAMLADILQIRGDPDQALRILREHVLPFFQGEGHDYNVAISKGSVADILLARGDVDEALRIRRDEMLPVFERLGDQRSVALTQGKIADVLHNRGELDEALRIRRERVLPFLQASGDDLAVGSTQAKIADVLFTRGAHDEALRILREQVLPLLERNGAAHEVAVAQEKVARILQLRGELDDVLRIRREDVLPAHKRSGDVRAIAATHYNIADVLQARGDVDQALRILREDVLPVYKRLKEVRSVALTHGRIADILRERGELGEARSVLCDEVLPALERLGDLRSLGIARLRLVDVFKSQGELDEALRMLREEVLPVFERLGDLRSTAHTRSSIAEILKARGAHDEALRLLREDVIPVYERLEDVRSVAITQLHVADSLLASGDQAGALRLCRAQTRIFVELADVRTLAVCQGKVATILQSVGEHAEALRVQLEEVLPVYMRLNDVRSIALTQSAIADLHYVRGDYSQALRLHREAALPVFRKLNDAVNTAMGEVKIAAVLLRDTANRAVAVPLLQRGYETLLRLRLADADLAEQIAKQHSVALPAKAVAEVREPDRSIPQDIDPADG